MLLLIYVLSLEWLHPPTVAQTGNLRVIWSSSFLFSHIHSVSFWSSVITLPQASTVFLSHWGPTLVQVLIPCHSDHCLSLPAGLPSSSCALSQASFTQVPPAWLLIQIWSRAPLWLKIFLKFMTFKIKFTFFGKALEIHYISSTCTSLSLLYTHTHTHSQQA